MHAATQLVFLTFLVLGLAKPIADDMLLYWRRAEIGKCNPFTVHVEKCNRCVCSADGIPYCTKMDCEKMHGHLGSSENYSD